MAISTTCYFSNSLVGVPQVAGDVDIYQVDSVPKFAVGTKFERQDGAVFRYAHIGSGITTIAAVLAPDLSATNLLPSGGGKNIQAPSSTYQMQADPVGVYPSAKGSRYIMMGTSGMASLAAHQLQGATLIISSGTGIGYQYRIKDNTASADPAAGLIRLELYDTVRSASLDTTSTANIVPSKYANLFYAAANTAAGLPVGVSLNTATTGSWVWIQTKGIAPVIMGGLNVLAGGADLLSIGKPAVLSTSGSVRAISSTTGAVPEIQYTPIVGIVAALASSGAVGAVALNLE